MAVSQTRAWTISAGAVGKKPVKRSYGGVNAAMNISSSRRHTTVSWHSEPVAGKGRTVWNGVVSVLVGAE
ncbi:hypothetical protein GTP41_26405 [Pseudoduganella sp. DS3]|uniref:Uncharacterized protein n=1 Tax=Pseudoduganella guangdongensis TaxID=2692179 RepID=A0A6N9HQ28_9BURK|nr:hypothetical protein [Pseudoduganella guangdongensis]MYN05630.1 hypothetical protein [Pseudoduganella guangdongensis]